MKLKDLPDVSVEHTKKRPRSVIGGEQRLTPIMLGPLRGCPTQEKHFASDCAACKSLYGRYLRNREANIEARIAAQRIVDGKIIQPTDIPMTASVFSR